MIDTTTLDESTLAHQQYDEAIEKRNVLRYKKITRIVYLAFGILCTLAMIFSAVAFWFLDILKFFEVHFNIPSIIEWIDSLPTISIPSYAAASTKLSIGVIYAIVYIVISIKLIKKLIKTKKNMGALCELTNSLINPKKEVLELAHRTISTYTTMISMMLIGQLTTKESLSSDAICFLVIGFLVYALYIVGINLYSCYDVHNEIFHKKVFALNLTKQFSLTIICALLVIMTTGPHAYTFIKNYATPDKRGFVDIVLMFVLPALQIMLAWGCVTYLRKIMTVHNFETTCFEFYGKIYTSDINAPIIDMGKKIFKKIIRYCVFFALVALVAVCFTGSGKFKVPSNLIGELVQPILYFISIILVAVSFRLIAKAKEERPIPLLDAE